MSLHSGHSCGTDGSAYGTGHLILIVMKACSGPIVHYFTRDSSTSCRSWIVVNLDMQPVAPRPALGGLG